MSQYHVRHPGPDIKVAELALDTKLANGSTLGEVLASVRKDLAYAIERVDDHKPGHQLRGGSLKSKQLRVFELTGKLQGYVNLLTLLGVSEDVIHADRQKAQS